MKLFACSCCGQLVYFENTHCTRCGSLLGFVPELLELLAFAPAGEGLWKPLGRYQDTELYHQCNNFAHQGVCNWMVPAREEHQFCVACRLNRTIPNLDKPRNHIFWGQLEAQKRRLVYSLLQLGLPVISQQQDSAGLAFDFLEDIPEFNEMGRVMTGHANGLITLNIAEADPVVREQRRNDMAEPYRSLLGHFRHESGHYYWDRLVRATPWLEDFRQQFGDERRDYAAALQYHYEQGPISDWPDYYVTAYASSHPWEDWAETWAHYLNLLDTLETAWQFGLRIHPLIPDTPEMDLKQSVNPYRITRMDDLIEKWLPLTYALNSLSSSMGHSPLYPFVLPPATINKLRLVHRIIHESTDSMPAS
ncbi:putative zinc-binding metallopeptidase [Marinospirillum sp.]|uniref:zinc-binding metallopeptidase family protein n=1 Tax=Marinospirillum sp. TaxID=2183934 RepID=UPI00384F3C0F